MWRTPTTCGCTVNTGSQVATACGASTVPASGTCSTTLRAAAYSSAGTLRPGAPTVAEFALRKVPNRAPNPTASATSARARPAASAFGLAPSARRPRPSTTTARKNGNGNAQVNRQ